MHKAFKAFLLLLFLLPFGVFAQDMSLDIFFDIRKELAQERDSLIGRYGEQEFYTCFACELPETNNPYSFEACLHETEACLKGEELAELRCRAGTDYLAGECVSIDEGCKARYGPFSYYTGEINSVNSYTCECREGYGWNNDRSACIETACPDEMMYYSSYRNPDKTFLHGRCVSYDDACRLEYGELSAYKNTIEGIHYCACGDGADWNEDNKSCEEVVVLGYESADLEKAIYKETIEKEIEFSLAPDANLARRLSGRILLQTEEQGQAWYINPENKKRYFLSGPLRAFAVMRELGLGATHEFIAGYKTYPEHVLGKILIDVDDMGRAYYIDPKDRQGYYLGSPADAFRVMEERGLGISNEDIRRIEVGEMSV